VIAVFTAFVVGEFGVLAKVIRQWYAEETAEGSSSSAWMAIVGHSLLLVLLLILLGFALFAPDDWQGGPADNGTD
jgi:hypothetical protein